MPDRTKTAVVLLISMAVTALFMSCAAPDDGSPADTPSPTVGSQPTASATSTPQSTDSVPVDSVTFNLPADGSTAFEEIMRHIPGDPSGEYRVALNDYNVLIDSAGVEPPGPDATYEEVIEYIVEILGDHATQGHHVINMEGTRLGDFSERRTYPHLGFDLRNMRMSASTWADGKTLEVLLGDYDPERTSSALASCEECLVPDTQMHEGAEYYVWDGGGTGSHNSPPLYILHFQDQYLLVRSGAVYRTRMAELVEDMVETAMGEQSASLAESGDYSLVARALAALDVNNALIVSGGLSQQRLDQSGIDDADRTAALSAPLLRPFTLVGSGSGYDGEQHFNTLAVLHDTPELASENADRLLSRILDMVDENGDPLYADAVERIEIGSEGPLLMVRLYLTQFRPLLQAPYMRSILVIHE
ncbi:MAG: hypothetical protein WD208_08535 [Dehalococcoidia bacterium]